MKAHETLCDRIGYKKRRGEVAPVLEKEEVKKEKVVVKKKATKKKQKSKGEK